MLIYSGLYQYELICSNDSNDNLIKIIQNLQFLPRQFSHHESQFSSNTQISHNSNTQFTYF